VSQEEIQKDIVSARERLAQNLGALDYSLSFKGLVVKAKKGLKDFYTDNSGQLRIDRIVITIVVALVALVFSKKD
jgi:hypothetical protein